MSLLGGLGASSSSSFLTFGGLELAFGALWWINLQPLKILSLVWSILEGTRKLVDTFVRRNEEVDFGRFWLLEKLACGYYRTIYRSSSMWNMHARLYSCEDLSFDFVKWTHEHGARSANRSHEVFSLVDIFIDL
uniref:Uncharacterized protein n=1 Tax=Ananas comosus var. bracteatus TaxID=296719 RepID=A0A6V7QMC1_ANACO|nr:unnamed protein product [Ananas comosus var. bracteatus]